MSRIEFLEKRIKEASNAYYNSTPIMEDSEFDVLVDELRSINPESEVLKSVGAAPPKDSRLQKVKHVISMSSLNKVNTEEEFIKWAKVTGASKFVVQEKLDGLSVELVYKEGKLTCASSRGDSKIGEDLTHTVKLMQNVKTNLSNFSGSLRGEIIIHKDAFEKHFKEDFANPRNAAAGLARRKEPDERTKFINVLYYDIYCATEQFKDESSKIAFIKNLDLDVVPTHKCSFLNCVEWFRHYEDTARSECAYEIDGLVIKVNSLKEQEQIDKPGNNPASQIALKFKSQTAKTKLLNVVWEVGNTGRITPVAVVEPVLCGGVTISNVTLHNATNVNTLELNKEDEILISRSGDVIPFFNQVVTKGSGERIRAPIRCPICMTGLIWEGDYLICDNKDCLGRRTGDFIKWVKLLEIEEVGPAFISQALQEGIVKDISDLYTLKVEDIYKLEGYKQKSAKKIIDNIRTKSSVSIPVFLAGLNIPNCSLSTFSLIESNGYPNLDKILLLTEEDLLAISGIGPVTAKQLVEGLAQKMSLINKLLTKIAVVEKAKGKLTGTSFCFTGEISIRRGVAQKIVTDQGGDVKSSVSKGLTYLVQADPNSQSTKSSKALSYETKVIGEEEFFDLVGFTTEMLEKYS